MQTRLVRLKQTISNRTSTMTMARAGMALSLNSNSNRAILIIRLMASRMARIVWRRDKRISVILQLTNRNSRMDMRIRSIVVGMMICGDQYYQGVQVQASVYVCFWILYALNCGFALLLSYTRMDSMSSRKEKGA
jgi:hypothetical protein